MGWEPLGERHAFVSDLHPVALYLSAGDRRVTLLPFPAIALGRIFKPQASSPGGLRRPARHRRMRMATDIRLKESLPEITDALVATYTECRYINHLGHKPLPSRDAITDILADLLDILYPNFTRRQNLHIGNVEYHIGDLVDGLHDKLMQQFGRALRHEQDCQTVVAD